MEWTEKDSVQCGLAPSMMTLTESSNGEICELIKLQSFNKHPLVWTEICGLACHRKVKENNFSTEALKSQLRHSGTKTYQLLRHYSDLRETSEAPKIILHPQQDGVRPVYI